jgi:diacylglycerol kinase family enzyme
MLGLVPRVLRGTHLSHRLVSEHRARQVTIESPDPLYLHVDGEVGYDAAHLIEIDVLPRHLHMIGRPVNPLTERERPERA